MKKPILSLLFLFPIVLFALDLTETEQLKLENNNLKMENRRQRILIIQQDLDRERQELDRERQQIIKEIEERLKIKWEDYVVRDGKLVEKDE